MTSWYLPQFGRLTNAHIPYPPHVEGGSLYLACFTYSNVLANDTARSSITFGRPFLWWATMGYDSDAAGHRFEFYRQVGSFQLPVFMKLQQSANALGTANYPAFLKEPYLIDAGESLAVELRNLASTTVASIQLVAVGTFLNAQKIEVSQ